MPANLSGMLSHYRLVEKIGEGGMGIVYRAHDTRLDRDVAIKVLSPALMSDPERRRRFLREARAAAAVSHPNIATVHEIDEENGVTFIVMELVEGATLRSLLGVRPPPIAETLHISAQIAEGLARAHRARVVHRDLKPDNVIVSSERHVKILDFGLAKLLEEHAAEHGPQASQVETGSAAMTRQGEILGTTAYMSPEQARGAPADERSDIFSFGITLYEMVTGKRPFHGLTPIETLAGILHSSAAPAGSLNPDTPPGLQRILDRCLEKDPQRRYQRADDLVADLQRINAQAAAAPGARRRRRAATIGAVALFLLAVAIAAGYVALRRDALVPAALVRVALLPLVFEGPADRAHFRNTLPLVFAERMQASGRLAVAPFAYSRDSAATGDERVVARDLGVDWVVGGRVGIEGDGAGLDVWIWSAAEGGKTWSATRAGTLSSLLGDAGQLASEAMVALGVDPAAASPAGPGRDPEALEHCLEGRVYLEGWDVQTNLGRAVEAARRAVDRAPLFAGAHALLSRALMSEYAQTRDPALVLSALESAERAVALDPALPEAHEALGVVQLYRGRSVEAARAFQEGLRRAPADDGLTRGIARAYAKLGRDAEAEAMYRRALDLRPAYWEHANSLGAFYFRRGRNDEAKALFRKVIDLHPDGDAGYVNLAAVHILAGDHLQAEPLLQAALHINPGPQTRNNLGVVYYATGRFEAAAREWRHAVESGQPTVMLLSNLGDAYRQMGRTGDARAAYTRAIDAGEAQLALDPEDTDARAMYATALAGVGRCDDARRQTERALARSPDNPTLRYYAAVASMLCGDREAAVRHATGAIEGGVKVDVTTNPDLKPLLTDAAIRRLLR